LKIEESITGKTERTRTLNRIGKEEILSLAQKIWPSQDKVAAEIASEALAIIREKYETDPTFFSGKSTKRILGGLFYLLGQRYGNLRTQREIAISLSTTEVTMRASCREWTEPLQNHCRQRRQSRGM
jgi:transcription initiation factor TFIIIB Brf1 subunit/transcription initiation factor TFIIB